MKKVSVFEGTRLDKGNVSICLIHIRYSVWQLIDKAMHNSENALRDGFRVMKDYHFVVGTAPRVGQMLFFTGRNDFLNIPFIEV